MARASATWLLSQAGIWLAVLLAGTSEVSADSLVAWFLTGRGFGSCSGHQHRSTASRQHRDHYRSMFPTIAITNKRNTGVMPRSCLADCATRIACWCTAAFFTACIERSVRDRAWCCEHYVLGCPTTTPKSTVVPQVGLLPDLGP